VDERSLRLRMECFLMGGTGREGHPSAERCHTANSSPRGAWAGQARPLRPRRPGPAGRSSLLEDEPEAAYDEVFRRVEGTLRSHRALIACELVAAKSQLARLQAQPQARRLVMIANDRRLQTWGLFDLLLEESRRQAEAHPQQAAELAQVALAIASRLPVEMYGLERVADFRCAALIELANARRRGGNPAGARQALAQAQFHLDFGTGDLLDQASLAHRRFELHRDEGEVEEAFAALDRARSLYRLVGDDRLHGTTLFAYPSASRTGSVPSRSARGGRAPVA